MVFFYMGKKSAPGTCAHSSTHRFGALNGTPSNKQTILLSSPYTLCSNFRDLFHYFQAIFGRRAPSRVQAVPACPTEGAGPAIASTATTAAATSSGTDGRSFRRRRRRRWRGWGWQWSLTKTLFLRLQAKNVQTHHSLLVQAFDALSAPKVSIDSLYIFHNHVIKSNTITLLPQIQSLPSSKRSNHFIAIKFFVF